jgi:predicted Zn-dependent protease
MGSLFKKAVFVTCLMVLIGVIYILFWPTGLKAVRPVDVSDPILKPTIQAYADAADGNPSAPKPRMELGMTYEGAELNELAELTYLQFVEQFPDRIIGWYRLAIVQNKQGKVEQAIQSLASGAKVAPENMDAPHWQLALWYIDNGRLDEAKEQLAIANSKRPNTMQVLIANGRIAIEENNPKLAIEILNNDRLISAVPHGYVYQLLGRAYLANGEEEKSRVAWSKAGQSKPNWADPWTQNIVNHVVGLNAMRQEIMKQMRANNISEVRSLINEYFTHDKENRVVRRLDASCDAKQGKVGQALEKYVTLVKEDQTDTVTMVLLAKLRMQIPQLQTPEEISITKEILSAVLEISTDHTQARTLFEKLN